MFGGLAVYLFGRMVMVIMENPGDRTYRDQEFPFDVWNGVLLPVERSSHESLQQEFQELISHPVLGKWLYLPMSSRSFEEHIERIARLIKQDDMRFGVYPKPRGERKSKSKKKSKKKVSKKNSKKVLKKAKKRVVR